MARFVSKVKRVGRSLLVELPRQVVDLLGVVEGNIVELNVQLPKRSYLGALRGIGAFTEEDRANHR